MQTFKDGLIVFSVAKQCIMRTRLGPSYSLVPLLDFGMSDANKAYMTAVSRTDQNIYRTLQREQEEKEK